MNGLKVLTYAALVSVLADCGDHDSSTGNVSIGDTSGDAIVGSGNLIPHTEDIHDFDEAVIFSSLHASVVQGDSFSVTLRLDDNLVEHVLVERTGSTLRIGLRDGSYRNITVEATVVMPDITRLDVSGATRVELRGFSLEHDLDLRGSGASTLAGSVSAHEVEMSISGATRLELEGSATSLELRASGASSVDLEDFPVADHG
jgi:hypothetical protein